MYHVGQRHISGMRVAIAVLTLGCLMSFGIGQVLGHHRGVATGPTVHAGSSLHQGRSASGALSGAPVSARTGTIAPAALPNAAPASIPLAAPVRNADASSGGHGDSSHHQHDEGGAPAPQGEGHGGHSSDGGNGEGDGGGD